MTVVLKKPVGNNLEFMLLAPEGLGSGSTTELRCSLYVLELSIPGVAEGEAVLKLIHEGLAWEIERCLPQDGTIQFRNCFPGERYASFWEISDPRTSICLFRDLDTIEMGRRGWLKLDPLLPS